jgi:hypothetical protein
LACNNALHLVALMFTCRAGGVAGRGRAHRPSPGVNRQPVREARQRLNVQLARCADGDGDLGAPPEVGVDAVNGLDQLLALQHTAKHLVPAVQPRQALCTEGGGEAGAERAMGEPVCGMTWRRGPPV